jgi:hypothetical protein
MTINVVIYERIRKSEWDNFVATAKNGHFMFYRDYMDYHADRFVDHSLMFYDEKERLIAVLPANIKESVIYSHQGLTFGGLLINSKVSTEKVYDLFLCTIEFLKEKGGIDSTVYKRMPDFYTAYPAQEDLYTLFLLDAKLLRRDVSVAIDMDYPYSFQEMRKRKVKKARKTGLEFFEESCFKEYWELLSEILSTQHNTNPVHSLEEIELLQSKFPNNIKCYTARLNGELLAGTVIYETESVVHTQYLANSEKGRELGALDLVIEHLIKNVYKDKKYFDFGISTEDNGRTLNKGLIAQKEGFGARAFVHDFYEIKIR